MEGLNFREYCYLSFSFPAADYDMASNVERPFWEEPFSYSLGIGGPNGSLKLRLENQQKHRTIQSPIDRQKSYQQKYVCIPQLLCDISVCNF